ncbi:permease-like cell division protein FtsX [Nonomuraea sp. SBT364]|uniref:permease-like cell division protein FtsX n=1 Tax=Nonomuraea sp. SBT364 TaxID=1580530 RepID=UPI00066CEB35|nr:permease-like cell division protein FtsX [Nonomuraea sp. SBT364]
MVSSSPRVPGRRAVVLIALGAVVLLLAGLPAVYWLIPRSPAKLTAVPQGALPQQTRIWVILCGAGSPQETCAGDFGADGVKIAVEEVLKEQTYVTSVRFVSSEDAFRWSRLAKLPEEMATGEHDGPQWFEVTLKDSATADAVAKVMDDFPGVAATTKFPVDFWAGKAEINVMLCPRKQSATLPAASCTGRGAATVDEKRAIGELLGALPQVQRFYFVNHARATLEDDNQSTVFSAGRTHPDEIEESFKIKLAAARPSDDLIRKLKAMPGVATLGPIFP